MGKNMKISELFFPQEVKCILCGREIEKDGICDNCYAHLPRICGKVCEKCGGEVMGMGKYCNDCSNGDFFIEKNFCIFNYVDKVKSAIIAFKFGGRKHIGYAFSHIIHDYLSGIRKFFDIIVPMPIHEMRKKERGFNQSEVLAEYLKEDYSVEKDVLIRVKNTPHQTGLNKENRQCNLDGAFKVVNKDKIAGKRILILDDIYTTGSTINECAKTLLKSGAEVVYGLCLARAKFRDDIR